jgi:hypothetical protein
MTVLYTETPESHELSIESDLSLLLAGARNADIAAEYLSKKVDAPREIVNMAAGVIWLKLGRNEVEPLINHPSLSSFSVTESDGTTKVTFNKS